MLAPHRLGTKLPAVEPAKSPIQIRGEDRIKPLYTGNMHVPVWSAVTLCTELVITVCVYSIIWKAYRTGVFLRVFAFSVLAYELLFNISYMFSREIGSSGAVTYNPYTTALAIFHGTFSLLMFVTLVVFFLVAEREYRRGENYFQTHRKLTIAFSIAWGVSILSGLIFFVSLYII